jgi:hypothetical protein
MNDHVTNDGRPVSARRVLAHCLGNIAIGHDLDLNMRMLVGAFMLKGMDDQGITDTVSVLLNDSACTDRDRILQCLDDLPLAVEEAREKVLRQQFTSTVSPTRLFDPWEGYTVPTFPFDVLPQGVQEFIATQATIVGCDPSAMAMATLGNFSAALDHRFSLKMLRHGRWLARPRLWILFVGDVSRKKSPMMDAATDELLAIQIAQDKAHAQALVEHERAKKMAKETGVSGELFGDEPREPPRHVVMDFTYEKVAEDLSKQERAGCLLKRDELAGWIGAMEKYGHGGRGALADRGFWLKSYDAVPYNTGRIARGRFLIELLSISVMGGIQPKHLGELRGLTSDGLLQRFAPIMMKRGTFAQDIEADGPYQEYATLTRRLVHAGHARFTLDDEALDEMNKLRRRVYDIEGVSGGLAEGFDGFVGKLEGLLGSLALILHLIDLPLAAFKDLAREEVTVDTVVKAGRIVFDFLLPHAFEFYRTVETVTGGDRIQRLASYILTSGKTRFVASDFTTNVRLLRFSNSADLAKHVSILVAGGWLKPDGLAFQPTAWTLNSDVHGHMLKRAKEEERRKAELARLMNSPRQPKDPPNGPA